MALPSSAQEARLTSPEICLHKNHFSLLLTAILQFLMKVLIKDTLKKGTSLCQSASFEPLCMYIQLSIRPVRESITQKKATNTLYFAYV